MRTASWIHELWTKRTPLTDRTTTDRGAMLANKNIVKITTHARKLHLAPDSGEEESVRMVRRCEHGVDQNRTGREEVTSISGLDGTIDCPNGDVNRLHLIDGVNREWARKQETSMQLCRVFRMALS
jgi:hypothetical protein